METVIGGINPIRLKHLKGKYEKPSVSKVSKSSGSKTGWTTDCDTDFVCICGSGK